MKIYQPKTIKEAIDELQMFFEEDMWTQFYPKIVFPVMKNGKKTKVVMYRKDTFKEKDKMKFLEYLDAHFNILRKQIKKLERGR